MTGHRDYVVVGSLSILGLRDEDELLAAVKARISSTTFLDAEEEARVRRQVDADLAATQAAAPASDDSAPVVE